MSRLKRKLETAFDGNIPSNLKLNENFCLIGTPLPPLEKSKDTGEFVPLWKQEVRRRGSEIAPRIFIYY